MRYRLFSALELPQELQQQLADAQTTFKAGVPRGSVRWVRPAGIHLTLKFYGDVAADLVPALEAGLRRAAQAAKPMGLRVQGLGVFPNPARPQVIWAGLEGDLVFLRDLASAVDAEASALGFPREARDFAPHLTLGRVRAGLRPDDHRLLLDFLGQAKLDALGEFSPDTLNLIASELRPTGAMYQRLFTVPIAHKENASGSY